MDKYGLNTRFEQFVELEAPELEDFSDPLRQLLVILRPSTRCTCSSSDTQPEQDNTKTSSVNHKYGTTVAKLTSDAKYLAMAASLVKGRPASLRLAAL